MMHIEVNDGYAREASCPRMRCGDRDAVEETEAHGTRMLSVMTGRADQRIRACPLSFFQYMIDRAHSGAGRHARGVERPRRRERIGIERHGAPGCFPDERDVLGRVDAADLDVGCRPGFLDGNALLPELRGDRLHDLESLDPFRMAWRRQMVGEDGRCKDGQRHMRILR